MAFVALALSISTLQNTLDLSRWREALFSNAEDVPKLLFVFSVLPRIAISILAGAALGLAGTLFQQILRNPLAEPATLGVSNGAQLALVIAFIWQPWLLDYNREAVAITGAMIASLLVFTIARSGRGSPLALIMAGLVTNMTLGAISGVAVLFNHEYLSELFIWQSGRLEQNGWSQVVYLAPRFALGMLVSLLFVRPMALLELGDEGAHSLGLRLNWLRPTMLLIAILISASVVAAVGVLAFVGLAVPALVRLAGARRFKERILWAPLAGGSLLWLADELVQRISFGNILLPTGVATALLGAPLLLVLLPSLKSLALISPAAQQALPRRMTRPIAAVTIAIIVLLGLVLISLTVGKNAEGWVISGPQSWDFIARWRGARVFASISAGILLGLAGTMIQRLTGNTMASPEVLGISAGASLGVIVLALVVPSFSTVTLTVASTVSAGLTLVLIMVLSRRAGFAPERMILTGVALATIVGALSELLIAGGGSSRTFLLSWMSGSTYRVEYDAAWAVAGVAAVSLLMAPLLRRWLDCLPLGAATAQAIGINLVQARATVIVVCAFMTACATIVIGPISFVGLIAPHIVRSMGAGRALPQLFGAATCGAIILVLADFLGRTLIFPWQIPAGLLAALVGGPYFLFVMWRRP